MWPVLLFVGDGTEKWRIPTPPRNPDPNSAATSVQELSKPLSLWSLGLGFGDSDKRWHRRARLLIVLDGVGCGLCCCSSVTERKNGESRPHLGIQTQTQQKPRS